MPVSVARSIAQDRRPPPASVTSAFNYVNQWTEAEALGEEQVRAFVLILRTRGCYWADLKGCSMCGYAKDTLGRSATPDELGHQLEAALRIYRNEPYVKIYTSGSFLDDREVDAGSRQRILEGFATGARRLLFETLPEFASEATLEPLQRAFPGEVEVALGLESTQPDVLLRYINKNSPPQAYFDAADRVRKLGLRAKGYLLLKPPYLTERESIEDVVTSVRLASPHFDTLSVNPVHIQNGTVVEWLYHRGRYRPPWLWSLTEVMRRGAEQRGATRLVTFPTAGGLARGPHNCGACDRSFLSALEDASLSQRFDGLSTPTCACEAEWRAEGALEPLGVEA